MTSSAILTDAKVRNARPRAIPYKLGDGDGLFLHVTPTADGAGSKLWRLRYWLAIDGKTKERALSLGRYPDVTLSAAREAAKAAKAQVKAGHDPVVRKRVEAQKRREADASTFEVVARAWLTKHADDVTPAHLLDCTQRLEKHVLPEIGALPLAEIDTQVVANLLRKVQAKGVIHMGGRVHTMVAQIFRYAAASGLANHNPTTDARGVLKTKKATPMPAVTSIEELRALLDALDARSRVSRITKIGARLLALLAIRTIELRGGRWEEVSFEAGTWTIPAARMKKRAVHVVPLSSQALALLRELHDLTGSAAGGLMFPGNGPKHPIMSEATINMAIKGAGYGGRHTGHGFRAAFSTIMNERGYPPDVVEFALAHVHGDKVRAAYNRSDYLAPRRVLMQAWADLVMDDAASKVVPITAGMAA